MIEDILARGWENFIDRTTGPLSFRFFMQPTMAAFLAIRAGLKDAREGKHAFLWAVVTKSGRRRSLLREGLKDTSHVLALAAILDFVYQLIVLRGVYSLELLFTAVTLAFVPYAIIRGPVNRLATWTRAIGERNHGTHTTRC